MNTAVQTLGLCVLVPFALALVHKAKVLRMRTAADEPLLVGALPAVATGLLALAALVEGVTCVLLLLMPVAGLALAAVLVLVYVGRLRGLPEDGDCGCFGEVGAAITPRTAVRRNLLIAIVAGMGTTLGVVGGTSSAGFPDGTAVAVALAVLAAPIARELQRRALNQHHRAEV